MGKKDRGVPRTGRGVVIAAVVVTLVLVACGDGPGPHPKPSGKWHHCADGTYKKVCPRKG